MVCTVLRVFAQTYTDQHGAHVHTHTLQVNDTLRSSVSASRRCLPLSTEHHWDISTPLPWEPHLGSQTSPSTFQYLSPNICMADWLYKHTYWKPCFLIPFVTAFVFCFFSSNHIPEFSLIPITIIPFFVILWHIRSEQPLHFSKSFTFQKCCCYFLPLSKWGNSKEEKKTDKTYSTV